MKKIISVILCAALLLSCFTACSPDGTIDKETSGPETRGVVQTKPQTVKDEPDNPVAESETADKEDDEDAITITVVCNKMPFAGKNDMNDIYSLLHDEYNVKLQFEYLPDDSENGYEQYKATISRIRAEIMAGKGPDVFILPTWDVHHYVDDDNNDLERKEPLFQDVEDAMRNKVFMELDDYLAKSDKINMDDHRSLIMDIGKFDGKQMVMPLTFNFSLTLINRSAMIRPDYEYTSFEKFMTNAEPSIVGTVGGAHNWFHFCFGDYVDVENEKLTITPEYMEDKLKLAWEFDNRKAQTWAPYGGSASNFNILDEYFFYEWKNSEGQAVPVYIPNADGGITATVTMYAAVNANTKHPDEAFKVLEVLFCENLQTFAGFYDEDRGYKMFQNWRPDSMFSIGSSGMVTHKRAYTDPVFHDVEAVESLLAKINSVRFTSELDCMLADAVWDMHQPYNFNEGPNYKEIAEELCKEMEMRLAE